MPAPGKKPYRFTDLERRVMAALARASPQTTQQLREGLRADTIKVINALAKLEAEGLVTSRIGQDVKGAPSYRPTIYYRLARQQRL